MCQRQQWQRHLQQRGKDLLSVGPNRRHRSGDEEPCRAGGILREPPGNHWFGSFAGGRTNRYSGGGDGREGSCPGRSTVRGFFHTNSVWSPHAEDDEDEELCLPAGWYLEDCGNSRTTKPSSMAGMLQGLQGGALHAPIPGRDHHGSSSSNRLSGAGDQSTFSGAATLAGAVLRGLHGTLPGVPGVLASVDASRRQNARREVRALEKRTGKVPCCREGPSGDQLRPGEAMGWGVPSGSVGSPLLGLKCEEARSGLPREIQVDPTALVGAHLRWGQRVSAECGESSRCRAKWKRTKEGKEEEKEREEETLPRRLGGFGVQGEQEGKEGAPRQKEQQRASKEMGRALSLDARWQTNLLCVREGGLPRFMPRSVQEQQGTSLSALSGKPPKQRLPEESGQGWVKRRRNRGVAPVRARPLQKRSSNCLPGQQTCKRSKGRKQGRELEENSNSQ